MKITFVWIAVIALLGIGSWYWWSGKGAEKLAPTTADTAVIQPSTNQPSADADVHSNQAGVNGSADQTNSGLPITPSLVSIKDAKLGAILASKNGMTLYIFDKDTENISNCSGQCAATWIPYVTASKDPLIGGDSVKGSIGTMVRSDGSMQVTYKGKPLYMYIKDTKAGMTTGNNVNGTWHIVTP